MGSHKFKVTKKNSIIFVGLSMCLKSFLTDYQRVLNVNDYTNQDFLS